MAAASSLAGENAMTFTQADLDMANRHVSEGEIHVLKQERVISRLRSLGAPTGMAEDLLEEFLSTLQSHREHRDRIAANLEIEH